MVISTWDTCGVVLYDIMCVRVILGVLLSYFIAFRQNVQGIIPIQNEKAGTRFVLSRSTRVR